MKSNKVQKAPLEAKAAKKDNILKILRKAKAERANKKEGVKKNTDYIKTKERTELKIIREVFLLVIETRKRNEHILKADQEIEIVKIILKMLIFGFSTISMHLF